ncbi:hypothetical protein [Streptomyces sp. NPDC001502]
MNMSVLSSAQIAVTAAFAAWRITGFTRLPACPPARPSGRRLR